MIVVDTSALIAVISAEPDAEKYLAALATTSPKFISAVSVLELTIVLSRRSSDGEAAANAFLLDHAIKPQAVDLAQMAAAQQAFMRFGKGRHAAALNFGDCFAYALAKVRRAALLFKGQDFALTDIPGAITSVR